MNKGKRRGARSAKLGKMPPEPGPQLDSEALAEVTGGVAPTPAPGGPVPTPYPNANG